MTWRSIFQESSLKEMSFKIKDLEKEDIDCNFSEEDRQKLLDYYKKNEISLNLLPKHLKNREIPVILTKSSQKTARNPLHKDLDGPKIKKKVKKAINNNEISLAKFQNLDTIVKKNPIIPNKDVMNIKSNMMVAVMQQMEKIEKIEKNAAVIKEIALNHPLQNNIQNMARGEENKEEEETKERLRNLFAVMRQNNPQIFFYILYKNFKDEMSRQISTKNQQISNIKMYDKIQKKYVFSEFFFCFFLFFFMFFFSCFFKKR